MRKLLCLMFIFMSVNCFSQNIQFNDLDLKNYLVNNQCVRIGNSLAMDLDFNNDGEIQTTEALQATELIIIDGITNPLIDDFQGLENLTNITRLELWRLDMNLLDLSIFPILNEFEGVSNTFQNIIINNNQLKKYQTNSQNLPNGIDFSLAPIIEEIKVQFTTNPFVLGNHQQLELLQFSTDSSNNINLSQTPNLKELNINGYQGVSIDFSSSPLLEQISLGGFNNIQSITGLQSLSNLEVFSFDLPPNSSPAPIDLVLTNPSLQYISVYDVNSVDINSLNNIGSINLGSIEDIIVRDIVFNRNGTYSWDDFRLSLNNPNSLILDNINGTDFITFNCTGCFLSQGLDLSSSRFYELVFGPNNDIFSLDIKNGYHENFQGFTSSDLTGTSYICSDQDELIDLTNYIFQIFSTSNTPVLNSYCSFIPGGDVYYINANVSVDIDGNGCDNLDPNYALLRYDISNANSSGQIIQPNDSGFQLPVSTGQHTITPTIIENPSYWNISPASVTVDFPTQASPFTQDFCVTANGIVEDLEVFVVPLEQARPGFDTDYMVRINNKGNQTASGTVTLDYEDGFMTLLSSTPTAAQPATNQLSWSFSNLQPFQMEEFEFTMTLNTPTQATNPLNINDILTFTGAVTGQGTDAIPADNTMIFDQTVVNSFDPNDKTCLQGETIDPADVGEYVHYMIRFENTGTASAINVVIKDEIDLTKFDITTLVPLGGSHDYYTRIREGNIVEFIHEDINLDFNDATNDGHVLFKIKTLNTLVAGDTFDNDAGIYFDFNFPIITNNEVVTVMSTASIGESTDSTISVYPNPTNGILNINSDHSIQTIDIFDLNGRMISKYDFTSSNSLQQIDLSQLGTGVYFVTVMSDLGKSTQKLIVE